MVTLRDEALELGTPLTNEELSRRVLGENKYYLKGFGNGPKPSSYVGRCGISSTHQKQLEKVTSDLEKLHDEQRQRDEEQRQRDEERRIRDEEAREEQRQRDEESQRRYDVLQKEMDGLKSFLMQLQNNGRI